MYPRALFSQAQSQITYFDCCSNDNQPTTHGLMPSRAPLCLIPHICYFTLFPGKFIYGLIYIDVYQSYILQLVAIIYCDYICKKGPDIQFMVVLYSRDYGRLLCFENSLLCF